MELRTIEVPERLDARSLARLEVALAADEGSVLMLRGSRAVFCRGMDLAAATDGAIERGARAYASVLGALRSAPRPTVALVEGEALGGGVGLLAACDLVIASTSATFALPEALFGLVPAMVVPVLTERMPAQAVRSLALSGVSHDARWARDRGLADEVCGPSDLPALVRRRARELSRAHPRSVRVLRAWMARSRALDTSDAIEEGVAILAELLEDAGTRRALRAFVEEGVAPWDR